MKRTEAGDDYNGWSNRETWAASLHMSNEYEWYKKAQALGDDYREVRPESHDGRPYWLANRLQDCFHAWLDDADLAFEKEVMVLRDVGSLWRIDWVEMAESWIA